MSTTRIDIKGVFDSRCVIRVTVEPRDADLAAFAGKATFALSSGAGYMQTYMTLAELEELESMCALARKELRDMQTIAVAA